MTTIHFKSLFTLIYVLGAIGAPRQKIFTNYDENEARMLLDLSAGAYSEFPENCLPRVFGSTADYKMVDYIQESCDIVSSLCSGYVVRSDRNRELIVVFRGTKTNVQLLLQGWSTLKPQAEFFGMGLVNRYFLNAHNVLWDSLESALKNASTADYRITFTGHSLGAALTTLAAARTVHEGYRRSDQVKVYTFGGPRVGNVEFAFAVDAILPESYRVVFRKDIVPHSPGCVKDHVNGTLDRDDSKPCDPNNLERAYHHSTEIWYPDCMDPGCAYIECTGPPQGEDFSCSDQYKFDLAKASDYVWDHRHYFNLWVPEYGKTGCDKELMEGVVDVPSKAMDTVMGFVDWIADKLGFTRRR